MSEKKLSIYGLSTEYELLLQSLIDGVDDETGEVDALLSEQLNNIGEIFEKKAVSCAVIVRRLEDEELLYKREIERLQAAKERITKGKERLKASLAEAMQRTGFESIKGIYANISFRKSKQTEIYNMDELPEEYIVIKIEKSPDKAKIKQAIESGIEVKGATVKTVKNILIK